jgi:hypothetical protein
VAPKLEELQRRFEAWRRTGRKGRRIPEALWGAATELARELGVHRVARALALDYTTLKGRVVGRVAAKAKASSSVVEPAFVELAVEAVARTPQSVVEFEGQCGKLTIRLTGHSPVDVVALVEALGRAGR